MSKAIKALSLWQPWASLMASGAKNIETRSWSTSYRGYVAIHAASKWNKELADICYAQPFRKALDPLVNGGKATVPIGCFVAVGKLRHCLSTTVSKSLIPSASTDEFWFGDYSENRFMWVFNEVWKLSSPVYARGHQTLWTLEECVKDVIIAMLPDEVREREFGE